MAIKKIKILGAVLSDQLNSTADALAFFKHNNSFIATVILES